METLEINSKKGLLKICWTDLDTLAVYSGSQAGLYASTVDLDQPVTLHKRHFRQWHSWCWKQREELGVFDLPEGSRILDIGSGVGVVDLLLYSYIKDCKLHLLDKEEHNHIGDELSSNDVSFTIDHPFYHSWKPVKDAIQTSNFDKNRFAFLEPGDTFPEDLDLILSSFSWCFHYPKEVYWEKVVGSLKKGGKLYLDVRLLKDKDIVGEISEELKCKPKTIVVPKLKGHHDLYDNGNPNISGHQCLWIKNI